MDIRGLHTLNWLASSLSQTQNGPKSAVKSFPQLVPWRPWVREKLAPQSWPVAVSEPEVPIVGVSHHWVYPPEILKECHLPKDHWTLKTSVILRPYPQVQTLPLEGPRSLRLTKGPCSKWKAFIFQSSNHEFSREMFVFGGSLLDTLFQPSISGTMLVSRMVSPVYQ